MINSTCLSQEFKIDVASQHLPHIFGLGATSQPERLFRIDDTIATKAQVVALDHRYVDLLKHRELAMFEEDEFCTGTSLGTLRRIEVR